MEKISVIIPCYNLDRYLEKCLDSILCQTYENLEIIAIDDGSTDKTSEILSEYAKKDSRIIFLKQSNAGASAAMNRGIELATGAFVGFVDNDDWTEPTMYEKLHKALTSSGADMAVCNFNAVYDDRVEPCYSLSNTQDKTVDIHDDVYVYFCRYCACHRPNNYTWSRLYKSGIIKESDVRLENFRLGSDTLFTFKLLPLMKKTVFLKEGLYNYVQRSGSSTHTSAKSINIAKAYADGFESFADYCSINNYSELLKILPILAFIRLRSVLFFSQRSGMDEEAIIEAIRAGFKGQKITDYLSGTAKI